MSVMVDGEVFRARCFRRRERRGQAGGALADDDDGFGFAHRSRHFGGHGPA